MPELDPPKVIEERRSRRSRLKRRLKRIPHPHFPHLSLTQVKVFRLFLLLSFFSILVLYGVFRSTRFQELLRRKTEQLLSAKLNRKVSIGGFDLSLLPPAVLVNDVAIANDPRGLPGNCFSAAEISLRGIPKIFSGRIDLPKLRLVSPRIVYEIFEDGTNNFPSLPQSDEKGPGIDVRLREALIQKGTIRFREWDSRIDVLLEDAALSGVSAPFSRVTHAILACRRAQFKLENNQILSFGLAVEATLSPGRVHIGSVRIRSDRLTLDASGGIENLKTPVIALAATASTTGQGMKDIFDVGLPLQGGVALSGTIRIPLSTKEGYRIKGRFEIPDALFGPFPMTGSGEVRADPGGLLVHLVRGEYAGGTLEAVVRVERLKNPPLPVRIVVKGRGLDFERFLSDLDLPGTGLMARTDLDTTLTFGKGGIEHADGAGSMRFTAAPGVRSAVAGRYALPTGGGGPLMVRNGQIHFDQLPLTTAGGARIHLDGTLALGTWVPSIRLDIQSEDAVEVEHLAENLYPAIQKRKLAPALKLAGSIHVNASIERSFGDPLIAGQLSGSRFSLHGVPFGDVRADFKVDRNVLTLAPFVASDAGGTLTVQGKVGWGGKLRDEYLLDGFSAAFDRWPIERVLRFLSFDLPLTGAVTGLLPLQGVTPDVVGTVPLVWEKASIWGQQAERLQGTLAFEKGQLRISDMTAQLGAGRVRGGGLYRYANSGFELALTTEQLPLDALASVKGRVANLAGIVDATVTGSGTVERPSLTIAGNVRDATWDGKALGKADAPLKVQLGMNAGILNGTVEAPGVANLSLTSETGAGGSSQMRLRLGVQSLALWSNFLDLPPEAKLDGTLSIEATLPEVSGDAAMTAAGALKAADLTIYGKKILVAEPAGFRLEAGRLHFDHLVLRGTEAKAGDVALSAELRLNGSVGVDEPRTLDVGAVGSFDAGLLRALAPDAEVSGRIAVDLRAAGTAAKPLLSGRIALDGVDFLPLGSSDPFGSITGNLIFVPGRVTTNAMTLLYSSGRIDLDGSAALDGIRPESIRVNAHLSHVRRQIVEGFRATISGDIQLRGDRTIRSAQGDITLERGLYDADIGLSLGALLGKLRPSSSLPPPPTSFDSVALDIKVNAPPGSVEVRNNVAKLRASGDLAVRGSFGHPILWGQLEAEEGGRLELRGIRYELVSGKILFSNPTVIDPFYELEGRTTIRSREGDYQVTVGVTGTVSRLSPTLSSDPPLSQGQIVSLITTGELPGTNTLGVPTGSAPVSSDESIVSAARDLIAGLVTQAATERTKSFFRLDRLQIDPVFIGSSFDAPRLTLGKSISKDLTVTYSYKASSNQEQVILVEYQLSPQAFLQFVKDETGVYSVDLKIRQRLR
ncbi:MAG: translocation/assembly module TamB domain-containing protein [Thermoanaerobaculia bacterium]